MRDAGASVQDAESLSLLTAIKTLADAAARPGNAMTLTGDYDAAKSAASQSSVGAIPTNPLLASDERLPATPLAARDDVPTAAQNAEEVWLAPNRTLSGTNGGTTATAPSSYEDIYSTAFKNGTTRLVARVYLDGTDIHPANVSTVVYSAYLLDDQDPDARTAINGHNAAPRAVDDVIFDDAAKRLAGERLQLQAYHPDRRSSAFDDRRAELSCRIHDYARRGRENHPSISSTRTMSDADTIAAIKSQPWRRIAEITAQPKPTYQIDGQMIAWGGYLSQLQQTGRLVQRETRRRGPVRGAIARIYVGKPNDELE